MLKKNVIFIFALIVTLEAMSQVDTTSLEFKQDLSYVETHYKRIAKNDTTIDSNSSDFKTWVYIDACQYQDTNRARYHEYYMHFFDKASKGDVFAEYVVGEMYHRGVGVKRDYEKAISWLQKAAIHGNTESQRVLSGIIKDCIWTGQIDKYFYARNKRELYDALSFWYDMGSFEQFSNDIKDASKRKKLYDEIKEEFKLLDYNSFCYQLDATSFMGQRYPTDVNKGFYWLQKSAKQGNYKAQYDLAEKYGSSIGDEFLGIKHNDYEAVIWARKSALQGDEDAQMLVAEELLESNGSNVKEAIKWFGKAANGGRADAFTKLGELYDEGVLVEQNLKLAYEYYKSAADMGDGDAMLRIGEMYQRGEGVTKNINEAIKWYNKASNDFGTFGSRLVAYYRLALIYHFGEGVRKDDDRAFKLFQKAAVFVKEGGTVNDAPYYLGESYHLGLGVDVNIPKAIEWYQEAIKHGIFAARAQMGYLYQMGVGVEKDEQKAFGLYKESAENGSALGQYRLANAYRYAIGTEKDMDLAIYWMSRAKDGGQVSDQELKNFIFSALENNSDDKNTVVIYMNRKYGVYYIPCKINGEKADLVFDTGASMISLSSDFADRLQEMGLLSTDDIIGQTSYIIADGSSTIVPLVNISDVEISGLHLKNVNAVVVNQQNAPLLLGQSVIERLWKVTIEGNKLTVHRD